MNDAGDVGAKGREDEVDRLRRRNGKLTALLEVTTALTREVHLDTLLDLILEQSIHTVDADRGSLFIVARDGSELISRIAQGEKKAIRVPFGKGIAGVVAQTCKPLNIPDAYADERFNQAIDKLTGYHTHSILCVPMLGSRGAAVGVVQALNHRDGPFTTEDEELLMAFGANAAAAIENANLYEEIERLFEGFVQASVTAIEARDPTTAGHSGRVAELAVGLMQALERSSGAYASVRFGPAELREMRYAALLHDFGKVGVKEEVLLKANKLYPHEMTLLERRFSSAREALRIESLEAKLRAHAESPAELHALLDAIDRAHREKRAHLDDMLEFIRRCNMPSVLERGGFERIQEIARETFLDESGVPSPLLHGHEAKNLSLGRGSLNESERKEIESHVVHTYNFLSAIPWTGALRRIPEFARGHHEKLDGSGYPRHVGAPEIPIQTRVMTISDIYDALTAADRPYKRAVPHERALDILSSDAREGRLDSELLAIFIEARIHERVLAG